MPKHSKKSKSHSEGEESQVARTAPLTQTTAASQRFRAKSTPSAPDKAIAGGTLMNGLGLTPSDHTFEGGQNSLASQSDGVETERDDGAISLMGVLPYH